MANNLPFRYVDPSTDIGVVTTAPPNSTPLGINWSKCIICQCDKTSEKVRCPADNSNKSEAVSAYETFANTLMQFQEIGLLMSSSVLGQFLVSGVDIKAELQENGAKWHRSCYLKYNSTELKRAQKRKVDVKHEQSETPCHSKLTRSQINTFDPKSYACFFCEEAALPGTLFNVSTFELDKKYVTVLVN